jgi:hypothetical protein
MLLVSVATLNARTPQLTPPPADQSPLCRTFEFRAVSADAKANGETDLKGKTAVMSTEERITFLKSYADYASAWFGVADLNELAVKQGEAEYAAALRHDQSCKAFNPDFRQLRHVGYKIAAEMGERYLQALRQCEESVSDCVTGNIFDRHLKCVFHVEHHA